MPRSVLDRLTDKCRRCLSGRVRRVALLLPLLVLYAGDAVAEEELVFGCHPFLPATELLERFTPLTQYLSSATGHPIRIEFAKDYPAHIQTVGEDRLDIAYLGPAPYVRVVAAYGAKPILAQLEVNGRDTFKGVIVVRRDAGIEILSNLAGKRFAFGDSGSTMSHLVPRYVLLQAGVDHDELAGFEHLGNHEAVAMGVLAGMFNAGAVKESVFRRFEGRGLKALAWTPPIATHVFVTRADMPEQTLRALREAFAGLGRKADGLSVLRSIKSSVTGVRSGEDGDYDDLRSILQVLNEAGVKP